MQFKVVFFIQAMKISRDKTLKTKWTGFERRLDSRDHRFFFIFYFGLGPAVTLELSISGPKAPGLNCRQFKQSIDVNSSHQQVSQFLIIIKSLLRYCVNQKFSLTEGHHCFISFSPAEVSWQGVGGRGTAVDIEIGKISQLMRYSFLFHSSRWQVPRTKRS